MNFILTRDKAITIAPAALKLSGIPDDAKLELTTLDGAVILTKSKMTAMEYVKLLTELTAHVGQMLLTLRDTCGCCDECDEDECACRSVYRGAVPTCGYRSRLGQRGSGYPARCQAGLLCG